MSADNDFLSVHDDHDDESESESDSDSAAAADDVSAVQCHFKRRLQGSPLRHSVAADDSIVVNTLCALSAFKPLTASIKGIPSFFSKVTSDFKVNVAAAAAGLNDTDVIDAAQHASLTLRQKQITHQLMTLIHKAPKSYQERKLAILKRIATGIERLIIIGVHANRLEELEDEWEEGRAFKDDLEAAEEAEQSLLRLRGEHKDSVPERLGGRRKKGASSGPSHLDFLNSA
ncbi:hypothetical protein MMC24_004369 [Lignoscripta atroalba]|nr:hypothetical protein [Lignoscripta atroalba]